MGDEVILQVNSSETLSRYNGEYVVVAVVEPRGVYVDRIHDHERRSIGDGYGYLLNEIHYSDKNNAEVVWAEKVLRRKYQPSEFSFEELMVDLTAKTPQEINQ